MNARHAREWLFAVGMALALSASASAQVMPSAGLQEISGKILSVDAGNRVLKLETAKLAGRMSTAKPMEFVLAFDATIRDGDRKIQPTDLWNGADVKISYKVEGGKHIAQSVTVQNASEASTFSARAVDASPMTRPDAQAAPGAAAPNASDSNQAPPPLEQ